MIFNSLQELNDDRTYFYALNQKIDLGMRFHISRQWPNGIGSSSMSNIMKEGRSSTY